jgi:trimeric autotransporter adhesin
MKSLLLLLFITTSISLLSQNVGVGTTTPSEKLDVNGNINVSGTIKANGVDGNPNQVLMKNGIGTMQWGDLCDYKNIASFSLTGAGSWTVPPGVTKIAIEAWGAGGGGSSYGGGGGGGYCRALFTVTPGSLVNFNIGVGGNGGGTNANNGTFTQVIVGGVTLTASGGEGSGFTAGIPSFITNAPGGYYLVSAGFTAHTGMRGDFGKPNLHTFLQSSTSTFLEVLSGGDGGNGANSINTGGTGAYRMIDAGSFAVLRNQSTYFGRSPGGGGGGGFTMLSTGGFGNGSVGGNGMVIIHY